MTANPSSRNWKSAPLHMVDVVSPEVRSRMMSGIRGKDTKPEMIIRKGLHRMGFRYRLHDRRLPGKPDIVLPKYRAVIFVHGCFWHGHDCHLFKWPNTRREFWRNKIQNNRTRDVEVICQLDDIGWRIAVIWECSLKGSSSLAFDAVLGSVSDWLPNKDQRLVIRGSF